MDANPLLTDDLCYQATVERDTRYDGRFVVAVRSTHIYCRPSCPARKPRRENVAFYPDAQTAEQAGYRACKRCAPNSLPAEIAAVEQVCRYIEAHLDEKLSLDVLGAQAGYSPTHLQRVFKRVMGVSPRQYAQAARLGQFREGLKAGRPITEALYDAGIQSPSTLYGSDQPLLGMKPETYRRGGQGMKIGYTIVDSPLGRLLVAATPEGLAALYLGDSDDLLTAALHEEYPAAATAREDDTFADWVTAVLAYLEGQQPRLELPIHVQATAFQLRVWEILRQIPYGSTRTYADIAREMGDPKAARAVAGACASNRVSLVIPCHRVVRGDGSLGGYRWGLDRKAALLDLERRSLA